jgi:predicted transcriptional regulator
MRTTLTLDDDIVDRLKRLAADEGITFKHAVNQALRDGLEARTRPRAHRTQARPLGLRAGVDLTKALLLAEQLEDEEIARELRAGR